MRYIRASDRTVVSQAEACLPGGQVRSGFSVLLDDGEHASFSHLLLDSACAGGSITIRDTTVTLTDAETALAVAKARRTHDMRHAYLGSRAPAFTDAQAAIAAAEAVAHKQATTPTAGAAQVRDAETITARAMRDSALAQRKIDIRNAWKTPR